MGWDGMGWDGVGWDGMGAAPLPKLSCVPLLFPSQITADLLANGIDVYPQKEFDEDSEDRLVNEKFRVSAQCCSWMSMAGGVQLHVPVMPGGPLTKKESRMAQDLAEQPGFLTVISEGKCNLAFLCLQEMIPFAVVGSDQEYQVNGRRILGRKTKWGTIEGSLPLLPSLLNPSPALTEGDKVHPYGWTG